jgi:hypothetical protein
MKESTPSPEINMAKIPGGAGVAGAIFAVGSMVVFLIGIPALRYIFPSAIALGCGIATVLHFIQHETTGASWILPAGKR